MKGAVSALGNCLCFKSDGSKQADVPASRAAAPPAPPSRGDRQWRTSDRGKSDGNGHHQSTTPYTEAPPPSHLAPYAGAVHAQKYAPITYARATPITYHKSADVPLRNPETTTTAESKLAVQRAVPPPAEKPVPLQHAVSGAPSTVASWIQSGPTYFTSGSSMERNLSATGLPQPAPVAASNPYDTRASPQSRAAQPATCPPLQNGTTRHDGPRPDGGIVPEMIYPAVQTSPANYTYSPQSQAHETYAANGASPEVSTASAQAPHQPPMPQYVPPGISAPGFQPPPPPVAAAPYAPDVQEAAGPVSATGSALDRRDSSSTASSKRRKESPAADRNDAAQTHTTMHTSTSQPSQPPAARRSNSVLHHAASTPNVSSFSPQSDVSKANLQPAPPSAAPRASPAANEDFSRQSVGHTRSPARPHPPSPPTRAMQPDHHPPVEQPTPLEPVRRTHAGYPAGSQPPASQPHPTPAMVHNANYAPPGYHAAGFHSTPVAAHPAAPDKSVAAQERPVNSNLIGSVMNAHASVTVALEQMTDAMGDHHLASSKQVKKIKLLGKGGFGTVYLATMDGGNKAECALQTKVALKELSSPLEFRPYSQSSSDVLGTLREAAIQALMVHTNIVRTYWADVSVVDAKTHRPLGVNFARCLAGRNMEGHIVTDLTNDPSGPVSATNEEWFSVEGVYSATKSLADHKLLPDVVGLNVRIAMEYCELGSLIDYVAPRSKGGKVTPLSVAIGGNMEMTLCAALTALDIARGLKLLHKYQIVHGDLKPHNILIASSQCIKDQDGVVQDPRGFVAKLSDFGLSKHMRRGETEVNGITHGSVEYMPLEARQSRTVTKASDVYAFGIIMWELWHNDCWAPHFKAKQNKLKAQFAGAAGPTRGSIMRTIAPQCFPSCPHDYASLVSDCLDKDPVKRPAMTQVVRRLESFIDKRVDKGTAIGYTGAVSSGTFGTGPATSFGTL